MGREELQEKINAFVKEGISQPTPGTTGERDEFWASVRETGTELWLDTGDSDAAREHWTAEMTALTTNNTLLNKEVQKGIYDELIKEADSLLGALDQDERVMEIAFVLNARHGLRLVEEFGAKVSVELHTALADDLEGIIAYGRRFHQIEPDHFIVKVPLTATGLLGARKLRDEGIPVNFTLEFSARQNVLVTRVAHPNYCNVFLGRLNSFVAQSGLGTGENVGERATLASQRAVSEVGKSLAEPTKQIAASMRDGSHVERLAGVDVFTMPISVAAEARTSLSAPFSSRLQEEYPVELAPGVDAAKVRVEDFWQISDDVYRLAERLDDDPPADGSALAERARAAGCRDMFPEFTEEDRRRIASDGKIPSYQYWKDRIASGEVAVDTLMNQAGLAAFTADQKALDDRVRGLIQ